jgi:hypothetical protein
MSERKRSGHFEVMPQYLYDWSEEECPNISKNEIRFWDSLKINEEY